MQNDRQEQIRKGYHEDLWRRAKAEMEAGEHHRQDPMAESLLAPKMPRKVDMGGFHSTSGAAPHASVTDVYCVSTEF